jgi:hypothetical protein
MHGGHGGHRDEEEGKVYGAGRILKGIKIG